MYWGSTVVRQKSTWSCGSAATISRMKRREASRYAGAKIEGTGCIVP
jgi:hypothetical protein